MPIPMPRMPTPTLTPTSAPTDVSHVAERLANSEASERYIDAAFLELEKTPHLHRVEHLEHEARLSSVQREYEHRLHPLAQRCRLLHPADQPHLGKLALYCPA